MLNNYRHTKSDDCYYGDLVVENGQPTRILHGEGYVDINRMPVFNYHLKDHLGNVRAVISSSYGPGAYTLSQASDYYPFGMAHTVEISSIKNGKALEAVRAEPREIMDDSKTFTRSNAYLYNGKEEQPMPGKWLVPKAFGRGRFYDAQLGRWHSVDPLAEKYYEWTPYNYVTNNPVIYIDPDGKDKIKAEASFKMTTGILGIGIKVLGIKSYFEGAKEKQISLNISFDTKTKELTFGGNYSEKEVKGGEVSGGLFYGFSSTSEKESSNEMKVGFNFKENQPIYRTENTPSPGEDAKEKKVEEGSIGIGTATTTDGEPNKITIGVDPEVNLFIIGTGMGINLSIEKK